MAKNGFNQQVVAAFYRDFCGAEPEFEFRFHHTRKWRFDLAWPGHKVAVEVDGGIWIQGRHNRGAAMKAQWEKENTAQCMGWRILKCEPKEVCREEFAAIVRETLATKEAKQ
jgi:very-short-patch-repair endonuclease